MNKQATDFSITPETKVGALLDQYPQLEEVLIEMAPAFNKLRNPILRKTVAKVATLRQVAQVGNISLGNMINTLRSAIGVEGNFNVKQDEKKETLTPPGWFDKSAIVKSFDARQLIEAGNQPIKQVFNELKELKHNEIYELITPFIPAPLIDMAKNRGFQAWSLDEKAGIVKTYFTTRDRRDSNE